MYDGFRECFGHYSLPHYDHVIDAEDKPIELFMELMTNEVGRFCTCCGQRKGYDLKSSRCLPACLVFTHTGVPVPELLYEEVQYKLTALIPKVQELKAYLVLKNEWSMNEWTKINFKKNKITVKPSDIMNSIISSWSRLEFVFYTKSKV